MTSIRTIFSKIRSLGLDAEAFYKTPVEERVGLWWLNSEKFNRLYAEKRPGVKVIDLGCGPPSNRAPVRDEAGAENYVGVDYSIENQPDLVANVARMSFASDSLKLVRAFSLFEHIYNYTEGIDELYRVLCPGGSLFIQTPFLLEFHGYPSDYFRYTHIAWQRILQDAGFKVIDYDIEYGKGFFLNLAKTLEHGSFSFAGDRWFVLRFILRVLGKVSWGLRRLDKYYGGWMYASVLILGEKPITGSHGATDESSTPIAAAEKLPMSDSSICFVSGCNVGTTYEYRVLHKQEQLAHYGIQSVARQYLPHREVTLEEALSYDILYLYRVPYDSFIEELIARARARDIPVVFGADDLVFEPDLAHWVDSLKTMSHDEAALYYEGVWRYRQTLLACDAVVTSTEYLAELARALGKPTFVHRNALNGALIQMAEPLHAGRRAHPTTPERLIIGYVSGTDTHNQDFTEASPALAQVLAQHPEVELHILGPLVAPPDLERFGERVRNLPLVHWTEVPRILNTFDINLGPLERENPFCRGKSEVKYIEAAILGIPTVASRTDAFEFAIRDGETGFLAGDTGGWIARLEQLVTDPALRRRMGEAARADVLARYAPAARGQELAQTFEAIQELCARQPAPAPDPQRRPLVLNWVFTAPIPGSGGHADIIRIMNLLASFGHQVNVYMVPYRLLSDKSDLEIRDSVRRHFTDLDGDLFKWTGGPMAESDAVILTYWETAYMLDGRVNNSRVFYFVQDWEPFFFPMGTEYLRAEQTYKMGFPCITLGSWLTEHLRSRYSAGADYFDLAVDHEIYYPRPVDKPDHPRVCFYARPSTPRRIFPIGVEALHLVHQRCPDVEIVFYGADDADLCSHTTPFPYTNLGILNEHKLAELFSSSDVGVVLSSTNCSLVPPEMMACKCAVVDLNRETVRGVLEHEVNALLAEPTPEAIADAVVRLLDDEPLRQRLVETAYQQMQECSWEKSARKVEAILRKVEAILYEKLPTSRRVLDRRRFAPQPSPPALADLPPGQQEHLDAIHRQRRQVSAQGRARVKGWIKRLLQADQGMILNGKPVQMVGELAGHLCIGQDFVARCDNLYRIDVLVSTYGRRNTRDVILRLKASPTATHDLAMARVNASLLADNNYVRFVFEPQPESRGKSYYFCVESPESAPGDAITLWTCSHVDLPHVRLYRNGRPGEGQLVFGLFYRDDQFGEVGERPLLRGWSRLTTHWDRLEKACQLFSSHGLRGLWQEMMSYRKWKTGKK